MRDKAPIQSDSTDNIYGVSDRELERQGKKKAATPMSERSVATLGRSTRSRVSMAGSAMDNPALSSSRSRRDAALSKLDDLTSTSNDARDSSDMVVSPVVEAGRNAAPMEASSLLGGGLGPRHRTGDISGLEINDSEIFGHLDSSFDITGDNGSRGDEGSATAGQRTGTRSADASTFNVSVFKRQPRRRQSSIVGRDDAPIRPSSRGPTTPGLSSTFSLGNFKRRARQPSILLSSAQKASMSLQRSRAASEASENAVDYEGEEESFLPEAEGTPVRPSRGRTSAAEDVVESVEGGTRSQKRKSTESHGAEVAKRRAVESDEEPLHQSIEMDDRSSPPSILSHTPELDDSVLAPPASNSSSEAGSPMAWPALNTLGKKYRGRAAHRGTKTPALDDDMSDMSEPPSLTHSPNLKATKSVPKGKGKTAARKESPKLSTADLAALLPRRRRKARRDGEGSENEESGSDKDVYDASNQPRASRKRMARPMTGSSSKANQTNPAKRSTRRTYGSRRFDKENTVDGDAIEVAEDASTPLDDTIFDGDKTRATPGELGEELRAASKKFKEVDKWELDYEEVVESSSPLPEGR
ncbi:hypothetical protein UCDDA912_g06174 [Diaporthe ampelina]|uniref:Uncharacterized protein n=1 Tax=Diaporthe ampelina TaxID=1214573 RepID=A0A0G2I119_9PEZI|nr:hypothetical protein UCDDA912_g06174 [Diaporthe ampelina]